MNGFGLLLMILVLLMLAANYVHEGASSAPRDTDYQE